MLSRVIFYYKRKNDQCYFRGIYDDWTVGWSQDIGVESVFITDNIPIAALLYKTQRTLLL